MDPFLLKNTWITLSPFFGKWTKLNQLQWLWINPNLNFPHWLRRVAIEWMLLVSWSIGWAFKNEKFFLKIMKILRCWLEHGRDDTQEDFLSRFTEYWERIYILMHIRVYCLTPSTARRLGELKKGEIWISRSNLLRRYDKTVNIRGENIRSVDQGR